MGTQAQVKKPAQKPVQTKAGNLHFNNLDEVKVPKPTQELKNHMEPEVLVEPDEDEGGSTHFPVTAANLETTDQQNISTLPPDEDPAQGYLPPKVEGSEDPDAVPPGADDPDDGTGMAMASDDNSDLTLTDSANPQSLLEADGEDDEEWDPEPDDDEDDTGGLAGLDMSGIAVDEDADGEDDDSEEGEPEEEIDIDASGEDMSLMDVDEMDDEPDGVAFASMGTKLHVLKSNRIIATMSKRTAALANREDVYMTDQFTDVVASEMNKQGVRAALRTMGFALAKVNITKASVVDERVKREVRKTTAAVRQVAHTKEQARVQANAIAAVAINRGFLKEHKNELMAALNDELKRAGVHNPQAITARVFAKYGPSYAKSIIQAGDKLSEMPEALRNQWAAALDMTDDDGMGMGMSEEDFGDANLDAGSGVFGAEDGDAEFSDEFDEEFEAPTIEAALSRPGVVTAGTKGATQQTRQVNDGRMSVTANAILNGEQPLQFL